MKDGERRRLVFTNLVNGVPAHALAASFRMTPEEVDADFQFVARKIRSYRFERWMTVLPCDTIPLAQASRLQLLQLLPKLNLDTDAKFSKIVTLPYTVDTGGAMSDAERAMLDLRMRARR